MAKYLKKKKKKPVALILILVLVLLILLAAFAIFIMPQLLYRLSGGGEEIPTTEAAVQEKDSEELLGTAVQFPLLVDDGRLEISSLSQYSGINPDCSNQDGTDIAEIVLKNTSDIYLLKASLTLTLADGTKLNFTVTDLPAGKSAMAFSTDNLSIQSNIACVSAVCEASFDESAASESDQVSAYASGTVITVMNNSGEDISQVVVYCRNTLDDEYFGGVTYTYTINNLPAGETATVNATDCILGMAEVVRIAVN